MEGRYVFAVRFRLDPTRGVSVDPDEFETRLSRPAESPGEDGWLFFRDNLWHGEIADDAHVRELASEALGVRVVDVDYRAFEVDRAHLTAFREAVAADLDAFRADDVDEAVNKYLGSSLEVRAGDGE